MGLRWRLVLWNALLLAAVLFGFAFISYRFLADGLKDETDKALLERAEHVLDAIGTLPNRGIEEVSAPSDEFSSPGIYVQVLTTDGQVIANSYNLGQQQLPLPSSLLTKVRTGEAMYTTETVAEQRVRLFHQPVFRDEEVVGIIQVGQSLQGLENALQRLRTIYAIGIVGSLILGSFLSGILVRMGLQPVVRVSQTASNITTSGDLKQRVNYHGPMDEVGRLANSFNSMVEQLERAINAQRRFVADTAHELRTPLSTILGNVDLLLRYGEDPSRRRSALASIKREGERTTRLAADLLLLAQADAGQNLELRPVDLDEVLVEVYEQAQGLTDGVFVLLGQCDPTSVQGDRDRIKQMLLNLVDNALKHTEKGGRVRLSLRSEAGMAELAVADTGSGIPEQDLPHIFERFYRVQDPTHRGKRSTGLGLAIVKWIAEEHGGNVTVESRVGKGSTFAISIPALDT